MQTKINVLDKGFVRLVSYMQPVDPAEGFEVEEEPPLGWTGDLEVIRNARTSFNADWRTGEDSEKDERLIHFMMQNFHNTPFEAMVFTFEVQAPLFVFRQWHRHRTWSYNEVSARYAKLDLGCYIPNAEHLGKQAANNRQARDVNAECDAGHAAYSAVVAIKENYEEAFQKYTVMLDNDIPREIARAVLPVNAYSRMFCTVDLHNLLHFISERASTHAQWEMQQYANALLELIRPICPMSVEAFVKYRKRS